MKKFSKTIQNEIRVLRLEGHTHRQIARLLHVGQGSAANYSQGISLTPSQKKQVNQNNYQKSLGKLTVEERKIASSKGGKNTLSHFRPKYSRKQVIRLLQNFHRIHGRIPTKRDFVGLYRVVLRIFKTWNSAIHDAGFQTNPVLFSKKHIANDGHQCDSLAEKIIDDWLWARKIPHERNVRYGNTRYTADFKINNIFIEFFGLAGQLKSYDAFLE